MYHNLLRETQIFYMKKQKTEYKIRKYLRRAPETPTKGPNLAEQQLQDDLQSISKYLSLSDQNEEPEIIVEIPKRQSEAMQEVQLEEEEDSFQYKIQNKPKKSNVHNFQKHLITTVRRTAQIPWPTESSEPIEAAKQIWQVFTNAQQHTKELLFGVVGLIRQEDKIQMLTKYKLISIYEKYGSEAFEAGQLFLRTSIINLFKNLPEENLLYERRITNKQKFFKYFYKTLNEIEKQSMNRRLPKNCKLLKRNLPATKKVNKQ